MTIDPFSSMNVLDDRYVAPCIVPNLRVGGTISILISKPRSLLDFSARPRSPHNKLKCQNKQTM